MSGSARRQRQILTKTVKYIGMDVHKNAISIAIVEEGRNNEVRFGGVIDYDMDLFIAGNNSMKRLPSKGFVN